MKGLHLSDLPELLRQREEDNRIGGRLGMSTPNYDRNNEFARILRGEEGCHKLYENDKVLAFLHPRPRTPKHAVVLSKVEARNILDVDPDELAHFTNWVWFIARGLPADGLLIEQQNEHAGDQEVLHLHAHLLPRCKGVPLKPPGGELEKPDVLKSQAEHIRLSLYFLTNMFWNQGAERESGEYLFNL
jgi:histidine triad (HIT) family protein